MYYGSMREKVMFQELLTPFLETVIEHISATGSNFLCNAISKTMY